MGAVISADAPEVVNNWVGISRTWPAQVPHPSPLESGRRGTVARSVVRWMPVSSLWVATAFGLTAPIVACEEDALNVVPTPREAVDEYQQIAASAVDILWVVDNSQTMAQEQQLLAENFEQFINRLTTCGTADDLCDLQTQRCTVSGEPCQAPDFHVGVVSTDPRDEGRLRAVGRCAPDAGSQPANGRVRYCTGRPNDCVHDPDNPASDPQNRVCAFVDPLRFVTTETPNPVNAFSQLVRFQLEGGQAAREEGISAAARALGEGRVRQSDGSYVSVDAPDENLGFIRDEATLFVIFVSDEEDSSFGPVATFYRTFEQLKGKGNEALVSLSAIVGEPDADGPGEEFQGGCGLDSNEGRSAAPGGRYVALSMYSRGREADVRVCDRERLSCGDTRSCVSQVPDLPGLCLPSTCESDNDCGVERCADGPCARCESGACTVSPPALLELLGQNGIFQSICADDYGPVLDALGFDAAGLSRKFPLSRNPDCREPVACCDEGVEPCESEAEICVKVDGQVVTNSRATGWVYDSGSNSIFFDGGEVPGPGAEIAISYSIFAALGAPGCDSAADAP